MSMTKQFRQKSRVLTNTLWVYFPICSSSWDIGVKSMGIWLLGVIRFWQFKINIGIFIIQRFVLIRCKTYGKQTQRTMQTHRQRSPTIIDTRGGGALNKTLFLLYISYSCRLCYKLNIFGYVVFKTSMIWRNVVNINRSTFF